LGTVDEVARTKPPVALAVRLAIIAVVLTAIRLAFAASIHLTEDEAYYRLWSEHLQAGYFDHPPMIAWWIRAGREIVGDSALGVRLLPCLGTGLATWLLGDTARRIGLAEATSARAALWWNATFTIALGGILATPDAPSCFFWTLCVWCLARTQGSRAAPAWWIAAGAAAGLCCLAKYSGFFLAPGVLLWLAVTGRLAELRRPWPWLAALAAAAVFLPNLLWNAGHDWLTFGKQFGRVNAHGLRVSLLPEFLATQFLLLNPLLAVLAVRGVAQAWPLGPAGSSAAAAARKTLLPLAAAAPFAVYLLAHSLHDRVQGHWPAPVFGALAIAAAFAAEASRPWMRRAVPIVGLGLPLLLLLHLALPRSGYLGTFDPTLALRKWDVFARDVELMRRQQGAAWVGVESYGVQAQLAAEKRIQAPLIEIIERERWFDWDPPADFTRPGLVLDLDRRIKESDLRRCFALVEPVGAIDRGPGAGPATRYSAFKVQGPKYDLLRQGCPWTA
jgi:4-amino-4-deoxy-L-arabinose transferase-like glycosyltransferase